MRSIYYQCCGAPLYITASLEASLGTKTSASDRKNRKVSAKMCKTSADKKKRGAEEEGGGDREIGDTRLLGWNALLVIAVCDSEES